MKIIKSLVITFMALSCAAAYAGENPANINAEILKELREIKKDLGELRKALIAQKAARAEEEEWDKEFASKTAGRPGGPNLKLLRKIKLPKDATDEEVEAYIDEIIAATEGQRMFSPDDPQVRMFLKVGGDRLGLLLERYREAPRFGRSYYLGVAIQQLTTEKNKKLILEALPECKPLVRIVTQKGWENDARDILIAGLDEGQNNLPSDWVKAVATFKDPATYDNLKSCLINSNNPQAIYKIISKLPGMELEDAVAAAWERAQTEQSQWRILQAARFAVQYGYLEALGVLIETLGDDSNENRYQLREIRPIVLRHINFRGSNAEIFNWYNKNHLILVFDKKTKKYIADEKKRDRQEGVEAEEF